MFDDKAKFYVYSKSVMLYHTLLFIAFVVAVKLYPLVNEKVIERFSNQYIQLGLPFLLTYLAAIYVLPEIGFYVTKIIMDD